VRAYPAINPGETSTFSTIDEIEGRDVPVRISMPAFNPMAPANHEYDYHPEFGYLCPSPLVRRRVRVALMSAAVGVAIGACIVLSFMDRRFADGRQGEQTSTFARTDRAWSAVGRAAALESEPAAAPLAGEEKTGMTIAREACEDEAASYLDSKCHLVRRHKAHTSRSMTSRLATVEIGRIRSTGDIERPGSAAINDRSTRADAGQINTADGPPAPSIAVSDLAPASATKPARNPRVRRQPRDPKGDGMKAFAYASPYDQYYRPGDTYRSRQQVVKDNWGWRW
jgi:hypothetical protein